MTVKRLSRQGVPLQELLHAAKQQQKTFSNINSQKTENDIISRNKNTLNMFSFGFDKSLYFSTF